MKKPMSLPVRIVFGIFGLVMMYAGVMQMLRGIHQLTH